MNEDEYEVTIGTGGWVLVVLSGIVTFGVLRWLMQFLLFPSVTFGAAIGLVVLLLLYWLAGKVGSGEEDGAQRVRKIVPSSGEVRMDGASGASVKAVPVRPEALKAQRTSSVVTPLADVGPAPIISQPAMPVAAVAEPLVEAKMEKPKAKAAAKPKAEKSAVKPKPGTAPAKPAVEEAPVLPAAETAVAKPKAEPKPKTAKPKAEKPKAAKPAGLVRLKAPRKGKADDLQEIEGIGPALEKLVNGMGFFHFDQIAAWTEADVALVDAEMKTFKGRIARDKWVEQARIIVSEGLEAFRKRAMSNDY